MLTLKEDICKDGLKNLSEKTNETKHPTLASSIINVT